MLLEKLKEYSERIDQTPVMYKYSQIHWIIDLDNQGCFQNFVQTVGEKKNQGKLELVPTLKRSGKNFQPILLADNGEYTLGIPRKDGNLPDSQARHKNYIDLISLCAKQTNIPELKYIHCFLTNLNAELISKPESFNSSQNITFRINGCLPFKLPIIQEWWGKYATSGGRSLENKKKNLDQKLNLKDSLSQQCIICGECTQTLNRHPLSIKGMSNGIPGKKAELTIISANKNAFESYGLENSQIAPTCHICAESYAKAFNHLLASPQNSIRINNLVYCFWTKEEHSFSIFDILQKPNIEQVKALIKSVFSGKTSFLELDDTPFYAAAFSASGARVVVRDWLDTTIGEVKRHLAHYFELQKLMDWNGNEERYISIYSLAQSLFREREDIPANVPQFLLSFAFKGGLLPTSLLFQAIKRNRAEQGFKSDHRIAHERAVLIKMILRLQEDSSEEDTLIMLNQQHPEPAYHCGRLLAVLESVQYQAQGKIGSTITDRYFGTASSAPASVFGSLLRGAQAHLGKIRKVKEGAYWGLQSRLEEVLSHLSQFPLTLNLHQQALFSLGYYHQKASDSQARQNNQTPKEEKVNV